MLQSVVGKIRFERFALSETRSVPLGMLGEQHRDTVVLLPPYGVTLALVARLGVLLAERFRVVMWESRGCPDAQDALGEQDFALATQASDLAVIARALAPEGFHFMSWCQASQLGVFAVAHSQVAPRSMTWIAPAGMGHALVRSEFDRCALPIYLEIRRNGRAHAEKLGRILDKYRDRAFEEGIAGEKLAMLHLTDPDLTCTFARYMAQYDEQRDLVAPLVSRALARVPTLAIHCRDDTYSHFSESVQLAKQNPQLRLDVLERGGHLQVFNDPHSLLGRVEGFLRSSGAQGSDGLQGAASC